MPWLELLDAPDTERQTDEVLSAALARGLPPGAWLEPACGGGRFLEALARRGLPCLGYDVDARALAYARRRLSPFKGLARAVRGDMRGFSRPEAFAAALNLDGSFRHLLTEREALRHLRLTAASLKPGGLYVLGLDLCDYAAPQDDEETWEAARDGRRASQVQLCLAPEPRRRREKVLNFVSWESGARRGLAHTSYELRSYDWGEWRSLVRASPFVLEETVAPGKGPAAPGGAAGAFLFVLRRA